MTNSGSGSSLMPLRGILKNSHPSDEPELLVHNPDCPLHCQVPSPAIVPLTPKTTLQPGVLLCGWLCGSQHTCVFGVTGTGTATVESGRIQKIDKVYILFCFSPPQCPWPSCSATSALVPTQHHYPTQACPSKASSGPASALGWRKHRKIVTVLNFGEVLFICSSFFISPLFDFLPYYPSVTEDGCIAHWFTYIYYIQYQQAFVIHLFHAWKVCLNLVHCISTILNRPNYILLSPVLRYKIKKIQEGAPSRFYNSVALAYVSGRDRDGTRATS